MPRFSRLIPLLLLLLPAGAAAQRPGAPLPRPALTVGVKGGFDILFDKPVFGVVARLPLPVPGRFAVQAGGDLTFLDEVTERQLTIDLLYDVSGLSLGGGPVFRNSLWLERGVPMPTVPSERETRTGWSLAIGLGGTPLGRSPFAVGLEYRLVWVEGFRPRPLTVSVSVVPGRFF